MHREASKRPTVPRADSPLRRADDTQQAQRGTQRVKPLVTTQAGLRVGIIAPPWVPIPPVRYGGTELVIDALARGLDARGNEVVLFTTGDSTCPVERRFLFRDAPEEMGSIPIELSHIDAAYDALGECDVIHDHSLSGLFVGQRQPVPVVTTIHGPFEPPLLELYRRTASVVPLIAISADQASRAPSGIPVADVIHHGLDLGVYPYRAQVDGGHFLALGRMHPCKGIDVAIHAAREAGVELVIAAKMREPAERDYYRTVIQPLLGEDVTYVGEVDHPTKVELLSKARALLNPIQWDEPFGLVMIEALACGTPVIASPRGAAPELVDPGSTGYLPATADTLVEAIHRVDEISRAECRRVADQRFSMAGMAAAHELLYQRVVADRCEGASPSPALVG